MFRKYWKIATATVFLTVAGFYCIFFREDLSGGKEIPVMSAAAVTEAETAPPESEETKETEEQKETENVFYVHVCGAVRVPGVYELPEGSRVFEAVEKAGGCLPEGYPEGVNLALLITDGMRIYIPDEKEAAGQSTEEGKVSINSADLEELMTIPGIGESRARDIITYREEHGGFRTIEEIMEIPGIKNALFEKIKDKIAL